MYAIPERFYGKTNYNQIWTISPEIKKDIRETIQLQEAIILSKQPPSPRIQQQSNTKILPIPSRKSNLLDFD